MIQDGRQLKSYSWVWVSMVHNYWRLNSWHDLQWKL